jgi:hypothetical protein
MNYDDLQKIGYRQQPDGSWSRQPARPAIRQPRPADVVAARLPDAEPQRHARQTLDAASSAQAGGTGRVTVRITRRANSLLDADNLAGGCKPVVDQLRYAGLIPNDDPASIDLIFRQEKAPKAQQGTQIELIWQQADQNP